MSRRCYTATVKTGPNAGAFYYYHTRTVFGRQQFQVDDKLGWHPTRKAAREAAEAHGWVYVGKPGARRLVHESAAAYYPS